MKSIILTSPANATPPAEVPIDAALVAALVADQHPDLADLPLAPLDAGWDNAMFRLGESMAARLPRRAAAADLILGEQRWLPTLAPNLTLPTPAPLRVGSAGRGYPWRWSVLLWMAGAPADRTPPDSSQAATLAAFLRSLHRPAPAEAPANSFRGVPLSSRAATLEPRLARLSVELVGGGVADLWRNAVATPIDLPPTWIHGDLHPRNVLTGGGAIVGIIDWGDLTAGDGATDLAAVWMLFGDPQARRAALAAYGASAATERRARGWAILFGTMLLETGLRDMPRHALIGERTLRRVAEPI